MSKKTSLFAKNAQTFYDYRTEEPHSLRWRYSVIAALALLLSVIFADRSDNLYLGIITAQSILAGFGFNVMISLAFNKGMRVSNGISIERVDKIKRINKLARELFYNVAYFNAAAVASIVLSVVLLLVPAFWATWPFAIKSLLPKIMHDYMDAVWWLNQLRSLIRRILIFALYASVIESFATFVRTVQRAGHYFENRIRLDPTAE